MDYITLNEAVDLVIPIPGSASGETVTYEIIKAADGSVLASGSMTFVRDEMWRVNYTPTVLGVIVLKANDATISEKRENIYRVIGASVTTPSVPSGDDLTTVANFKIDFNIKSTFTDHDTIIQNLITQKSKRCSEYCGRKFAARDLTEYYDGDDSDILVLNEYPINSITSIHDDTERIYAASALIASTDYVIKSDDGIVKFDGVLMTKGINNIKVIYNAGFSTLPGDLVSACEMLVMADYIEHVTEVNVAAGDVIIYKPDKLRKEAYAILDRYVRYARH